MRWSPGSCSFCSRSRLPAPPLLEPLMNAPARPAEAAALSAFADRAWDERIVPALTDYIAVPAKSPMFDADWANAQ